MWHQTGLQYFTVMQALAKIILKIDNMGTCEKSCH